MFGFFGSLGQRIVRLDLLGDGRSQLVHAIGVHLGYLLLCHEDIGRPLLNGILEQGVNGVDLAAGLFGGGFELRISLFTQGVYFLLLTDRHVIDRFQVEPKGGANHDESGEDDSGELLFQFLPHGGNWGLKLREA